VKARQALGTEVWWDEACWAGSDSVMGWFHATVDTGWVIAEAMSVGGQTAYIHAAR
jgi:hypothetical protein